jgi:hypothetical protein
MAIPNLSKTIRILNHKLEYNIQQPSNQWEFQDPKMKVLWGYSLT